MKPVRTIATVVLAALPALVGCGADGATLSGPNTSGSAGTSGTAVASTGPAASASTSAPASVGPAGGPRPGATAQLPYEVGSVMSVIGVDHDGVLNLRKGPGSGYPVQSTLDPLATGLVATGRGRLVPGGPLWAEVTWDGTTGWASLRFLAVRDGTDDLTSRVIERLDRRPVSGTMEELGRIVARSLAGTDPPSSVVMSKAPTIGDLGEVTYDVVGLGDDSVRAFRLNVFGQPVGDGSFSLKSVEATSFCARGTPAGGELCP